MAAPDRRWLAVSAKAVLRHPALWGTALVQVFRLAVPGWWRRAPFLPLPDPAYMRFRMLTAYGDPEHPPEPADVISYLTWCKESAA